jgi:hypothetical protein
MTYKYILGGYSQAGTSHHHVPVGYMGDRTSTQPSGSGGPITQSQAWMYSAAQGSMPPPPLPLHLLRDYTDDRDLAAVATAMSLWLQAKRSSARE